MVDVKNYLRQARSWLSAEDVVAGDKLEVLSPGSVDNETFKPRSYLIMPVRLLRTGQKWDIRLGPRNVGRVSEVLGNQTDDWVGNFIEVLSIENYPGLRAKGLLLRGLKREAPAVTSPLTPAPTASAPAQAPTPPPTHPSLWTIHFLRKSKDLIEDSVVLSEMDWTNFVEEAVREELLSFGLIEKTGDGYRFTDKAKEFLS